MRGIECTEHSFEEAALDEIVASAVGEIRHSALGRFRIGKSAGLVGALVDGRAADLGEPDRLALRHPAGRRGQFSAADALAMRVRPPVPKILGAKNPRLAEAVGDRAPGLRSTRRIVRVIKIISLSAAEIAGEVDGIVGRARKRPVKVGGAVAPVCERCVVVDADHVDRRRSPQRIERKAHFVRIRRDDVGAVFGPIGAVGHKRAAPHDRLHVGGKLRQPRHRRIDARGRAHAREAFELGADEEGIDAAGARRQRRVVQDHAPIIPTGGRADAEERIDLRRRSASAVGRARLSRRRTAGDASAPGIGRLRARTGPGIGERIASRDVHHQEGIERDF